MRRGSPLVRGVDGWMNGSDGNEVALEEWRHK